ncbi:MAG: PepSY domain-containing protein [Myxococcaceae bacterium]|nr:PepSY domain-containing protein [Myxococcaceae bacterium]MCI0668927.1 PepSY domain-containing protein [Myxococcaceae bacterium]
MILNFTTNATVPRPPRRLRPVLFQLHRWVGLVLGLWLVVAGLSGSALVFGDALSVQLDPALHRVAPSPQRAPLSVVLENLRAAHGPTPPRFIRMPERADAPYEAWMDAQGSLRAYVDPASGRVLGSRCTQESPVAWLRELHVHLLAGETGETVVGLGGVGMLLLCLTGLVLWWPGRRKLALGFTVRRPLKWRRGNHDVHKVVGILALPLLLVGALTGALLVFHAPFDRLLATMNGKPPVAATASRGEPPGEGPGVDALLAAADAALPGARTTRVDLPPRPGAPLKVRKRLPGEVHPNGMSFVLLDPASGAILQVQDARTAPLSARVWALRYPLHIGSWGGLPTRLLALLAGLAPGALFLSGFFLWLERLRRPFRTSAPSPGLAPQAPPST